MEEELSARTRNGLKTEITLTTQCLLAFISFEKMGLFVPAVLVEDRVNWGHLPLKKCLRELATTPQLAHVPLPMPWVFSAASLARTKPPESTRTGTQRRSTSCSIFQWFFQRSIVNPAFPAQVLFTDEACFTRDGYFNSRNSLIWDDENRHAVFIRVHQARFNVNIWGGILGDYLLAPGHHSRPFEWVSLPGIPPEHASAAHTGETLAINREMWFQHDGAPAHFSLQVRAHLNRVYREKWKGRRDLLRGQQDRPT